MASSTFKVGDRVRFVRGNCDWIGCEGVITELRAGRMFSMRITKSNRALRSVRWGYGEGRIAHLDLTYMEKADGLLDI